MNIQPYYPSRVLIVDSTRRTNHLDNPVNFKIELDDSFNVSEGNFYIRLIDIAIEQLDKPGIPYNMRGFVGVQSNLAISNHIVGAKHQGANSGCQNLIGCFLNKSDKVDLQYLGNLQTNQFNGSKTVTPFDFGRVKSEICDVWFPIKSPGGICSFKLVDSVGEVYENPFTNNAITDTSASEYISAFTEEIEYVYMVFEIKQVKPMDETKAQLKVSRPYLPI